jgi:hypothetical protein
MELTEEELISDRRRNRELQVPWHRTANERRPRNIEPAFARVLLGWGRIRCLSDHLTSRSHGIRIMSIESKDLCPINMAQQMRRRA